MSMDHILVVDDNLDLAENLVEILEDAGFTAECFDSPTRALGAMRSGYYALALIDLRMPGMDGIELHRALKLLDPSLKTLAMTAFTRDERVSRALGDGVLDVFAKPVAPSALLQSLRAALAA